LPLSDLWLFAAFKKHLGEILLHVVEDGLEIILKSSKLTNPKKLVRRHCDVELNQRDTIWKNQL
jgi:hypothetical protein